MHVLRSILTAVAGALLLCCGALSSAHAEATPGLCGTLEATRMVNGEPELVAFPLEHTDVKAVVSGFVAEVTVTQIFGNPLSETIEAIYIFPLPHESSVHAMDLKVGERHIVGKIHRREEARKIYEEARQQGKTAALLDQERPNIFTQSVANIRPGDRIEVRISYTELLKYEDGGYEFVFPMVVGPRYIPGAPVGKQGPGTAPDTDKVPDASRITPPVLKPGQRSGHDIALQLDIDAGVPVVSYESVAHQVEVRRHGGSGMTVELTPEDSIPNKDFRFRYRTAGPRLESALLTHQEADATYFTLLLQPQVELKASEIIPKEMYFVLDTSGSMYGQPLEVSKAVAAHCMSHMNPQDTFQIVEFNTQARTLFPKPLGSSPQQVAQGKAALAGLSGNGGTDPLSAIRRVASSPKDPKRLRIVFFMTDGYVGNDDEIVANIASQLQGSRVFVLGVGSSPNRYLIDEMARAGKGAAQYVTYNEDFANVASTFHRRVANPALMDIEIDWSAIDPSAEIYPFPVPDLYGGQPLALFGKMKANASGTLRITGELPSGKYEHELTLDARDGEENSAMAKVWARQKVQSLERSRRLLRSEEEQKTLTELITTTALHHQIMSQFTSFVAVDETVRGEAGQTSVTQPVELPEGMDYEHTIGGPMTAMQMAAPAPGLHKSQGYRSSGRGGAAPSSTAAVESLEVADISEVTLAEEKSKDESDGDQPKPDAKGRSNTTPVAGGFTYPSIPTGSWSAAEKLLLGEITQAMDRDLPQGETTVQIDNLTLRIMRHAQVVLVTYPDGTQLRLELDSGKLSGSPDLARAPAARLQALLGKLKRALATLPKQ